MTYTSITFFITDTPIVNTPEVSDSNVLVQLELDGDKLSSHYKIAPYNDFLSFEKYVAVKECIYYGKSDVLELFLSYGLNPNVRFASGITALNYAVLNNQTWIARILLEAGANQNLKYKGKTALQIATSKHFNTLTQLLIEYQELV